MRDVAHFIFSHEQTTQKPTHHISLLNYTLVSLERFFHLPEILLILIIFFLQNTKYRAFYKQRWLCKSQTSSSKQIKIDKKNIYLNYLTTFMQGFRRTDLESLRRLEYDMNIYFLYSRLYVTFKIKFTTI